MQEVSTRSVANLVQAMGMSGVSKSQVRDVRRDRRAGEYLPQPPAGGRLAVSLAGATYLKVRPSGRIVSVAVTIAVGVNYDVRHGTKALIAQFDVATGKVRNGIGDTRTEADFVASRETLFPRHRRRHRGTSSVTTSTRTCRNASPAWSHRIKHDLGGKGNDGLAVCMPVPSVFVTCRNALMPWPPCGTPKCGGTGRSPPPW